MTVAECIAIPFVMPEQPTDILSGITCFLSEDLDGSMVIVTEGYDQKVIGGYRMTSGMLVLVSEGYQGDLNADVIVPQEHKLYYAGTLRPTPAKRFTLCAEGKNWYYEKDKRERLTTDDLKNLLTTHGGPFPIRLDCDDLTVIPEASMS